MTDESTEMAPHAATDTTRTAAGRSCPSVHPIGVFLRPRCGHLAFRVTAPSLIATSAFGSAHGLLNPTALDVARNLVLFLAVVFWLGLAYWVYRDARRRVDDPWLVGTATLLAFAVPYIGPVVYMLFRTPETLAEVQGRELEIRELETRLGERAPQCPVCRAEVESSFLVCPVCTTRLKLACAHCESALEPAWQICPYCATPPALATGAASTDLDAALTAEVAGNGNRQARPRAARASATRS